MSIAEKIGPRPAPVELPNGVAPAAKNAAPSLEITSLNVSSVTTKDAPKQKGTDSMCDGNSCFHMCSRTVCNQPSTERGGVDAILGGNGITLQRKDGTGAPLRLGEFRVGSVEPRGKGSAGVDVFARDTSVRVCGSKAEVKGQDGRLPEADQKAAEAAADARGDFSRWTQDLQVTSLQADGGKTPSMDSGNWRCDSISVCVAPRAGEKVKVGAVDVLSFEPNQDTRNFDTQTHGYMHCC